LFPTKVETKKISFSGGKEAVGTHAQQRAHATLPTNSILNGLAMLLY
jgi:hypothetical protein